MFDLREHPLRLAVFLLAIVGLGFFTIRLTQAKNEHSRKMAEAEAEGGKPQAPSSTRLGQVQKLQYTNPEEALKIAREMVSNPQTGAERSEALDMIPALLNNSLGKCIRDNRFDDAKKHLDELAASFPEHPFYQSARLSWAQNLINRCMDAIRGKRDEEILRLLDQIREERRAVEDRRFLEVAQTYFMEGWSANRSAGNLPQAQERLDHAASLVPSLFSSPIVRTLMISDLTGADLHAMGEERLAAGRKSEAIPFLIATCQKLHQGGSSTYGGTPPLENTATPDLLKKLRTQIVDGVCDLGDHLDDSSNPVLTSLSAKDLFKEATSYIEDAGLRALLYQKLLENQIQDVRKDLTKLKQYDFHKLSDPDYLTYEELLKADGLHRKATLDLEEISNRTMIWWWTSAVRDLTFDPWSSIPQEVKAAIQTKYPGKDDEPQRREQLGREAEKGGYPIPCPTAKDLQNYRCEINARWGLLKSRSSSDDAWTLLRNSLRETTDSELRNGIITSLQGAIRRAQSKNKFEELYTLAGFYASEIGIQGPYDKFAKDFRSCLETSIARFEKTSPMKHVFMLSILAESFPSEAFGLKARATAMTKGVELASRAPLEPRQNISEESGLPDLSIARIENGTEYHLLCFYKGPETFFIHCNPYRRGSLVLKNGKYEVGVISPNDQIVPYRTEIDFNSKLVQSSFKIETQNGEKSYSSTYSGAAYGDYSLFRIPDDSNSLTIDPKKGTITSPPSTSIPPHTPEPPAPETSPEIIDIQLAVKTIILHGEKTRATLESGVTLLPGMTYAYTSPDGRTTAYEVEQITEHSVVIRSQGKRFEFQKSP